MQAEIELIPGKQINSCVETFVLLGVTALTINNVEY